MPVKRQYKRRRNQKRVPVRTMVRKEIRRQEETKMYDGGRDGGSADSSGVVYSITSYPAASTTMGQGVNDNEYIGTKIMPTGLIIRGAITYADVYDTVRVLVIQCKGLFVPAANQLFDTTYALLGVHAGLKRTNDDRYRVLADRRYLVTSQDKTAAIFGIRISGKKLTRMTFSDASGTVESGGIYIAFLSDSNVSSHPAFQVAWRLYYKDA